MVYTTEPALVSHFRRVKMNYKHAPRLRIHCEIRRWTLHPDDYIPLALQVVDFNNVDPNRSDLLYLDCSHMSRVTLDQMEARMISLWDSIKWANEQNYAYLFNCFKTGDCVPVYNSKRLTLPTDGGQSRLRITVQGVHCDTRLGLCYSPILIIEEVISVRQPSIKAGRKQMILPDPVDEYEDEFDGEYDEDKDDDGDEDQYDDDDEDEPPVKCRRVCNTLAFSHDPSEWDDEIEVSMTAIETANAQDPLTDDVVPAEWIKSWLEAVKSPQQQEKCDHDYACI
jgi:hypothetical protein